MWWFLMRFYVMLCMILMVSICYCCFDNFQMGNFVSTTIFYYNPKISFFMINLEGNSMVMRFKNILILWYIIKCGSNNRLKIALALYKYNINGGNILLYYTAGLGQAKFRTRRKKTQNYQNPKIVVIFCCPFAFHSKLSFVYTMHLLFWISNRNNRDEFTLSIFWNRELYLYKYVVY